jgi:hypothetical protein
MRSALWKKKIARTHGHVSPGVLPASYSFFLYTMMLNSHLYSVSRVKIVYPPVIAREIKS